MADLLIDLTPRQRLLFDFWCEYWFARGYPPTVREACTHLSVTSPNAVVAHLKTLERKGLLRHIIVTRNGCTKSFYALVTPLLVVRPTGRGGFLIGSCGGPVPMSREAWMSWLQEQLAAVAPNPLPESVV